MDEPIDLQAGAAERRADTAPPAAVSPPPPPCALTFGETCGLRHAVIDNGVIRAAILLDKGANVRQLWHVASGTRTLAETSDWREQLARFRAGGLRGSSYSDCYEGGYQDVLPARMRVDDDDNGGGSGGGPPGRADDCIGEAAIVPWEVVRMVATPAAVELVCRAALRHCRLRPEKRFRLRRGDARLTIVTTIRNESARGVSFSWTHHPALGGDLLAAPDARLWLPERDAGITRHDGNGALNGDRDGNGDIASAMAASRAGWTPVGSVLPAHGDADRFVTFAHVRAGEAALASGTRGVGVRLRWDPAKFAHLWLWTARRESITCVAPEPSTTYLPELGHPDRPEILRRLGPGESDAARLELSVFATPA